jgi:major membrane immunogen (membrane-anchored lipoprotein)
MKKFKFPILISSSVLIIIILLCSFLQVFYKDGVYTGKSQSHYTKEPYVGQVKIIIKEGKISSVNFSISDTAKKELFDEKYERYFIGNNEYIQQCREDWKGVQTYPAKLIEKQDIDKVDAITGATWSYNIFKASVKEALKK